MTQPRILGLCMMLPLFNRGLPAAALWRGGRAGLVLVPALAADYASWSGGIGETLLIGPKRSWA